jgi:GT2 family glycosyltransferase
VSAFEPIKVVHVSLDEPLAPLPVEERYGEVLLFVERAGRMLGRVSLPALPVVPPEIQRDAIARELGEQVWQDDFRQALARACGATRRTGLPEPTVSVIVCTRDRPDDLERCLASLEQLEQQPLEVVVVDNCPSDSRTREVCDRHPVRYVLEPVPGQTRARNRGIVESRGELVAFTDDDCVVDPRWLNGLAAELEDPLVMGITGFVAPLELESEAQAMFDAHGSFFWGYERWVVDGTQVDPATTACTVGAGANSIFTRRLFEEVGLFAEDLGPGTPACAADDFDMYWRILAAGYRIVFDPARLIWHRHRRDQDALRRILHEYGVSTSAYAARRLVSDRELSAIRVLAWWWFSHFPHDVAAIVRGRRLHVPLRYALREVWGTLAGPWALFKSRRSRRGIPPLELTPAPPPEPEPFRVTAAAPPSISVVVPSCNRCDLLIDLLRALAVQTYPADRFEAVVVLDGSTDRSAEAARALDVPYRVNVVEQENAGVAAARNRGTEEAAEPIVLFIDDDIIPGRICVAEHAEAHAGAGPNHVALGYCPPVIDGGLWAQTVRAWWEDHYRRKLSPGHVWTYVDFVTGNTSMPRPLLQDLGGFDPAFRVSRDDWELAVRLFRRNPSFGFYPGTAAKHYLNTSLEGAVRLQRKIGTLDVILTRRHPEFVPHLPIANATGIRRDPTDRELARRLAKANRLERMHLRGKWRAVSGKLLWRAYLRGVLDAVSSKEDLAALVGPLYSQPYSTIPVQLDGAAAFGGVATSALELELRLDGRSIGRVGNVTPGGQWDSDQAVQRLEDLAWPARAGLLEAELNGSATAVALRAGGGGDGD